MANSNKYFYSTGRRKTANATVRLFPTAGVSTINTKVATELYLDKTSHSRLALPFVVSELNPKDFYFTAMIKGSGRMAQLEALVLAISKSLIVMNPELRKVLRKSGLTTRDPRMVERKKPGLLKARKAEQYSKR